MPTDGAVPRVCCAISLPNIREYGDPCALVRLGKLAEDAGWDGVFVWDNFAVRDEQPAYPIADPWAVVAALAVLTTRVRLGVMVSVLPRLRPAQVARQAVTIDLLAGGRLIFGGGIGSHGAEEFTAFGEEHDPRVRAEKLDEGLAILEGLWTGERFTHDGRWFTVRDQVFLPTSPQRPRMPVWIAGRWPAKRPFRRAARWDGVFPASIRYGETDAISPLQLAEIVDYVRSHRQPDRGGFDVALELMSSGVDHNRDAALVASYGDAGLTWWIEKLGWFRGDVAAIRDRIAAGPPVRRQ